MPSGIFVIRSTISEDHTARRHARSAVGAPVGQVEPPLDLVESRADPLDAGRELAARVGRAGRVEFTRLGLASLKVVRVPGLLAKLDHCVIHVSDWAVSYPFYRDVLGAELIDRGHGTCAYRFGSEQLNVHDPE